MKIEITVFINPFFNAALSRKDTNVDIIDRIKIKNNGPVIRDSHLKIETKPFLTEFVYPIDLEIAPGETVEVEIGNFKESGVEKKRRSKSSTSCVKATLSEINPTHLFNLSKSYISKFKVVLYEGDKKVIAESDIYNVKLLTCNTWPGCRNTRIMSAFVVTSQPSVAATARELESEVSTADNRRAALLIARHLRKKNTTRNALGRSSIWNSFPSR